MPHIHEKIDFTADVYVVFDNKVLLRFHDKYDLWCVPGGHIELDEDPTESAVREVKEEVGLDVVLYSPSQDMYITEDERDLIPPAFMNRHRINETHEHISLIYFASSNSDEIAQSAEEYSEDCRWLTRDEVLEMKELRPSVRKYALAALDALQTNPEA